MKNLTILAAFGILLLYLVIVWQLDLPEGGARFGAATGLIALSVLLYKWARRAYDKS